jgi:hypothetical protein
MCHLYVLAVRGLEKDFQLQENITDEDNIFISFHIETNARELPKNITYTLRVS